MEVVVKIITFDHYREYTDAKAIWASKAAWSTVCTDLCSQGVSLGALYNVYLISNN